MFVKGRLRWRRVGDEFEDFNKGEVEASCKVGEGLQLRIIYQVGALLGPQGSFAAEPPTLHSITSEYILRILYCRMHQCI